MLKKNGIFLTLSYTPFLPKYVQENNITAKRVGV